LVRATPPAECRGRQHQSIASTPTTRPSPHTSRKVS
jgi:hypothetical protein